MHFKPVVVDEDEKELGHHGSESYPFEVYYGNFRDFRYGVLEWHWHDELEFHVVEKGSVEYRVGHHKFILNENEFAFINSSRLHSAVPLTSNVVSYAIVFHPSIIDGRNLLPEYRQYIQAFIDSDVDGFQYHSDLLWCEAIRSLLLDICTAYNAHGLAYEVLCKARICEIWYLIINNVAHQRGARVPVASDTKLKNILDYIYENYANEITLNDLATIASISKSECCRFFKRMLGTTPSSYINRYRINRSCEMLSGTDRTISQVALACGYNQFSYFSKLFRQSIGCTPKEYRRRCKSEAK
jgi:AraC-like DNA-binding protein